MSRVQIPSSAPLFRRAGRHDRPVVVSAEGSVTAGPGRPDRAAAARAIAELIRALGLDPATEPELAETPARVADLYAEVFAGLDPAGEPELATFPAPASE